MDRPSATGRLARVATRRIGELLAQAGGGRLRPDAEIDTGVSLQIERKIADEVRQGEALGRVYLRHTDDAIVAGLCDCFEVDAAAEPAQLIRGRIEATTV